MDLFLSILIALTITVIVLGTIAILVLFIMERHIKKKENALSIDNENPALSEQNNENN